ncbi:hypothetical deacetylase from carbohydrate esterase family CE10 [Postia placenta Mad-698-R]|nr:hypothetical deacetylase from carbohydrate esterase family CE10 [Postia placenta Mad-698-R]
MACIEWLCKSSVCAGAGILIVAICAVILAQPFYSDVNVLLPVNIAVNSSPLRILLLTAHPDDECMFFSPSLTGLNNYELAGTGLIPELFSLCLSIGDADGLGDVRRNELKKSLDVLGIHAGRRWIEDRPVGLIERWRHKLEAHEPLCVCGWQARFLDNVSVGVAGSQKTPSGHGEKLRKHRLLEHLVNFVGISVDKPAHAHDKRCEDVSRLICAARAHRSDLKDNFTASWDAETIADVVRPYVLQHNITTILTFDERGISGHPNHISLLHGAAHLLATLRSSGSDRTHAPAPRLFTLVSVPLLAKYTGPLAALHARTAGLLSAAAAGLPSPFLASLLPTREADPPIPDTDVDAGTRQMPVFASGLREYVTALRAMAQHRSQLVWFRYLYVAFSRYMWVNELREVFPPAPTDVAGTGSP